MIYSRFNHPLFFVKIFCRILLKKICKAIYGQPREQIEGWWLMFILILWNQKQQWGDLTNKNLRSNGYICVLYIYSPCLPGLVVAHGKHGKNRYQVVVMVILVGLVVMFWKLGITTNYRNMIYIYHTLWPPSYKMVYKPHECYSYKMLFAYHKP